MTKRILTLIVSFSIFSAVAQAALFTSIVVYGDSLSDNGNLFAATGLPGTPYFQGRRSNGPVAVEQLAASLGSPLLDFAWIGATTGVGNYGDGGTPTSPGSFHLPGMQVELAGTQGLLTPSLAGGLFVVWGGPNDFLAPSPLDTTPQAVISRAVGDLVGIMTTLESLGARHILVPGMPDLGLTPYFKSLGPAAAAQASALTDAFNSALQSSLPRGVLYYDTASLLRSIVASPSSYGFTNVTDPCFNGTTVCPNPGQYVFWDDFHPTTATDALVAKGFQQVVVPEPGTFSMVAGAVLILAVFSTNRRRRLSAAAFLLVLLAPAAHAQTSGKKKVGKQSDLPRFTYPVTGSASELVQADAATFNAFAMKVKGDLESIFRDYDIEDKATLRTLLEAKLDLQQITGENEAALETVASFLKVQEKPADQLTAALFPRSMLQAAVDSKSTSGPAFEEAFRKRFRQAVDPLPWNMAQDLMKSWLASTRTFTKAMLVGEIKTQLDPAVQKSGVLDNEQAWDLIAERAGLQFYFPLKDAVGDILSRYIVAHNLQQPDIWKAREVTLTADQKLTPVLIGIWDSGVDLSLFGDQVFSDPRPTVSGNHGLAYDDNANPSTSWIYPLTPAQAQRYPGFREQLKGFDDLKNGIDSPEARVLQERTGTLSADQFHAQEELDRVLDHYVHGTHVAGIVARGNPAVRLVVARFHDDVYLPFQPTPEWARRIAADFQKISDYFRTRNVRVVNMSWIVDPQEFETWLSNTGAGADPAERKRRAVEVFGIWHDAVESAIKNAPNTLFFCAAGNSNGNAGFVQGVPASLRLPNLVTVGAVNQAGDETSFTSYGDTVVVDANGFDVESYFPGGSKMKLSGTSMASPNVANLAAKLFALGPSLTPAQVIDLIKKGATGTEDGRRHLIDPKRSVALLQASKSTK
ncbi:MAG: S8 family serine peptidase [Bryobacteraceae bacterium]